MKLTAIITQEFIINTDTEHYRKIMDGNVPPEQVERYIYNEARSNQLYWNALNIGKTEVKIIEE